MECHEVLQLCEGSEVEVLYFSGTNFRGVNQCSLASPGPCTMLQSLSVV